MTEVSHQPCHFCDSSDAFSYNSETGIFKCFSCDATPGRKKVLYFGPDDIRPLGANTSFHEEGISLTPYVRDYRGIAKDVIESHGGYFTKQDNRETVHWTYPNGTKHRTLPKDIRTSGVMDRFFGQDEYVGGKVITITEGEEDRLSVIQMMGDWPTVSLPGAKPSKEFWLSARDYLRHFDKIVLSIDNDEPGDAVAEKIYRMFPGKTYRVNHGKFKDANDFLWDKEAGEPRYERDLYKTAWWNAQRVKPESILTTAEDFIKLYEETPNYEFIPTGLEKLDKMMLGIHKGAFTTILAPTGIGKTEFMRYLEDQIVNHSNYSVAACHGEETRLRSLLGLASYVLQENVTRKDLIEEKRLEEQVRGALETIGKTERFYNFTIKSTDTVDDIVDQVRFLATGMGCDFVFIEPIQDFVSGTTSEKESLLTDLANKLKLLCAEVNVGVVVIAHSNADGEAKYCKSLTQSAAYEIILERDPNSEDPYERNKTYVSVGKKNRTGGGSGPGGVLIFDQDTYCLTPDLGPVEPETPKSKTKEFADDIPF